MMADSIHPSLAGVLIPDLHGTQTSTNDWGQYVVYDPAQVQIRYLVSLRRY